MPFCYCFISNKIVTTNVQCFELAHDCYKENRQKSVQVTSVHKVGLTIYDSLCLRTQKSVHCPN